MECLITLHVNLGLHSHMTWCVWKKLVLWLLFPLHSCRLTPILSFHLLSHNCITILRQSSLKANPDPRTYNTLSCHLAWEMSELQWQGMESFSRKTLLSLTNWRISEWAIAPFTYFLSQPAKLTVLPKANHHVDYQTGTQWNNTPRAGTLFCTCYWMVHKRWDKHISFNVHNEAWNWLGW